MEEREVMLGVPKDEAAKPEEISLDEHRAMVGLPEEAVEVVLNCKVFHDGDIMHVSKTLKMEDIRTAFRKADDGYIDDEDTFVITEKGKAYFEEMVRDSDD